jgi:hypothetical protein
MLIYGCEWVDLDPGFCRSFPSPCLDATLTNKEKCVVAHNENCFWNSANPQIKNACTQKSLVCECGEILTNTDNICINAPNIFSLYEII